MTSMPSFSTATAFLVVPGGRDHNIVKSYQDVDVPRVFCEEVRESAVHFWDDLPDKEPAGEKKEVLLTFEAIADAVYAYLYSIPVICLNACFTNQDIGQTNNSACCDFSDDRWTSPHDVLWYGSK